MPEVRRRVYNPGQSSNTPVNGHPPSTDDDRNVNRMVARIACLERDVQTLLAELAPPAPQPNDAAPVNRDARWHCEKCGYLLGFYSIEDDVMRTRYKEHIVYARCGPGGFLQVVCRGCSHVNTQAYVEQPDPPG